MKRTKYALISDGSSDRCLIPIIDFLLDAHFPNMVFEGEWANLAFLREPARTLHEKIQKTVEFYEPDWVFVHRDAEREENPLQKRLNEIETAIAKSNVSNSYRFIKVIPIRMIESWLLIDKNAIRKAANNPNGIVEIELPNLSKLAAISLLFFYSSLTLKIEAILSYSSLIDCHFTTKNKALSACQIFNLLLAASQIFLNCWLHLCINWSL